MALCTDNLTLTLTKVTRDQGLVFRRHDLFQRFLYVTGIRDIKIPYLSLLVQFFCASFIFTIVADSFSGMKLCFRFISQRLISIVFVLYDLPERSDYCPRCDFFSYPTDSTRDSLNNHGDSRTVDDIMYR